jgi:hypothetical protein
VSPPEPEGVVDERSARAKLAALHRLRGSMDSALVAFSGGAYVRNSGNRSYYCKNALMQALEAIRAEAGYQAEILVGVNTDDLGDCRPGQQAVGERGGRWPMVEVGCLRPRSAGCPGNSACPRGTSLPPRYQQSSHNLTLQRRPSREQRDDFGSEKPGAGNCRQSRGEGEERHEDRWY